MGLLGNKVKISEINPKNPPKAPKRKRVQHSIILVQGLQVEAWGSLTEICRVYDLPYNELRLKKFPFSYNRVTFIKTVMRKSSGKLNFS